MKGLYRARKWLKRFLEFLRFSHLPLTVWSKEERKRVKEFDRKYGKFIAEAIDSDEMPDDYTGWVKSMYDNNGAEILYLTQYKDGLPNGLSTTWYKNGQKEIEETYKDGNLMTIVVWKPNGEKCPVSNVRDGNGVWISYTDDGTEGRRSIVKDGQPAQVEKFEDGQGKWWSWVFLAVQVILVVLFVYGWEHLKAEGYISDNLVQKWWNWAFHDFDILVTPLDKIFMYGISIPFSAICAYIAYLSLLFSFSILGFGDVYRSRDGERMWRVPTEKQTAVVFVWGLLVFFFLLWQTLIGSILYWLMA